MRLPAPAYDSPVTLGGLKVSSAYPTLLAADAARTLYVATTGSKYFGTMLEISSPPYTSFEQTIPVSTTNSPLWMSLGPQ